MENNQNVINKAWPLASGASLDDQNLHPLQNAALNNEKTPIDIDNETSSEKDEKEAFLPKNKKDAKKMRAMLKTPYQTKKHPRVRKAFKIASVAAAAILLGLFVYNTITVAMYNGTPTTKDPYTPDNVFDTNGNDFVFGDDGQIILDTMDESEKNVLSKTFGELLLNDAQAYYKNGKIGNIKNVLSISLLPFNLNDKKNTYDKYYLSILFSDENDTYCLNYLAGSDFLSNAEFTSDFFIDFINYLNHECAISSCTKMSDAAKQVKNLFEDVTYVRDAYKGYWDNGDKYYFIPVYNANGVGKAYYAWAAPIDTFEKNPMQVLYDELTGQSQENTFDYIEFTQSESLQKVFKIINEQLSLGAATQNTAYHVSKSAPSINPSENENML